MNNNKLIQKLRQKNILHCMYRNEWLYQAGVQSKDKRTQITSYLIHNISPAVNMFIFTKRSLARKFNCSMMTVSRALNALKKTKSVKVDKNSVSLVLPKTKKGGNTND